MSKQFSTEPEFITVQEAADYLRETDRSVRRRISDGQLAAYRIGKKRIVLKRTDVEAFIVRIPTGDKSL